jgi:hypothetical protein
MSSDIWTEIESLRKELKRLEHIAGQQYIKSGEPYDVKLVKITSNSTVNEKTVYTVQAQNVDEDKPEQYIEVRTLDSDSFYPNYAKVMIGKDSQGVRYILPGGGSRLILVRDVGGNLGEAVHKDQNGAVTITDDTEQLPMVIVEPTDFFHNAHPPRQTGRIYPGLKMTSLDGTIRYYLVFIEGHGPVEKTFTASANVATATTIMFSVSVDGQGNVKAIGLSAS